VSIALVLLAVYAASLVFSLVTHASLFKGSSEAAEELHASHWGPGRAAGVLAAATATIAWMSEILVGGIEPTARTLGLNNAFVGVFVVASISNAAEYFTAVSAAVRDRMDLSLAIATGASVQVALFVAPLLVLASFFVGPAPMDLAFSGGLVLTVLLAVVITGRVAGDGRSEWLRGVQLLAVYVVLGLAFYFAPLPG
jgi:Ca2+:H+ antiporter